MVCERCWDEFQRRHAAGSTVTYPEIVAANNGRCTPADQCGERHDIPGGQDRCRCGERRATEEER